MKKLFALLALALSLVLISVSAVGADSKASKAFASGFELFKAGKNPEAIAKFKEGLQLEPSNPLANLYIAEAYTLTGDSAKALPHYKSYLSLAPAGSYAQAVRKRLAELEPGKPDGKTETKTETKPEAPEAAAISPVIIKKFLEEKVAFEQQKKEEASAQEEFKRQQDAASKAANEVIEAKQRRIKDCRAQVDRCVSQCKDEGTSKMFGTILGGALMAKNGMDISSAQQSLLSSGMEGDQCTGRCESQFSCNLIQ